MHLIILLFILAFFYEPGPSTCKITRAVAVAAPLHMNPR
jgi:hypothetical protein